MPGKTPLRSRRFRSDHDNGFFAAGIALAASGDLFCRNARRRSRRVNGHERLLQGIEPLCPEGVAPSASAART